MLEKPGAPGEGGFFFLRCFLLPKSMKKEAWPEGAEGERGELIESNLSDGVGV